MFGGVWRILEGGFFVKGRRGVVLGALFVGLCCSLFMRVFCRRVLGSRFCSVCARWGGAAGEGGVFGVCAEI